MVIYEREQMLSLVQGPVIRTKLSEQGVIDLKHIHAVKTGIQSLVTLVVCDRM